MPRKRCCGRIDDYPICYKSISSQTEQQIAMYLGVEEIEAVKLKVMKGYNQEACAAQMGLTRLTFQRILTSARRKIAQALVEGLTIIIKGGHYIMKNRVFQCLDCGETWEVEPCTAGGRHEYEIACPKCGSFNKAKLVDGERHVCGGEAHHGHGSGCGCCGHEK